MAHDQELADARAENAKLRARVARLEQDVDGHDVLVERLRRENLLLLDRLRTGPRTVVEKTVTTEATFERTEEILS